MVLLQMTLTCWQDPAWGGQAPSPGRWTTEQAPRKGTERVSVAKQDSERRQCQRWGQAWGRGPRASQRRVVCKQDWAEH